MDKPDAEIFNWLKVDPALPDAFNIMVDQLSMASGLNQLSRVGSKIRFVHAVVDVTVDGQSYRLDPSFKAHQHHLPSVDIASASGFSKAAFLHAIAPGNVVNTAALKQELTDMTDNLQQALLTSYYDQSTNQVLGGWEIIADEQAQLSSTSVASVLATWSKVPTNHSATLRIQYGGINQLVESRNIYGKQLYIVFDHSNRPELWLDNTKLATGSVQSSGSSAAITFTVNQPYGQNFGNQSWTQHLRTGGVYNIINSWGNVGEQMPRHYQKELTELIHQGNASATEISIYTLAGMGMNWLFDINIGRQFNNKLNNHHTIGIHSVGIAGTTDVSGQSGSPYVDVGGGFVAQSSDPANFVSVGMLSSAFEHGVIRHTQDLDAVSTARLMDIAASAGMNFYQANSSNWNTVKNQLVAYSNNQLNLMQQYINAGFTLVAPERGDLTLDSWSGSGYFTFLAQGSQMSAGYLINGGLKGGFSSTPAPVNYEKTSSVGQVIENTWQALLSFDPINMSTGDFLFYGDDLSTGSGVGELNFARSYNSSHHRANNGVGLGWKHNHDISARADSNIALGYGQKSAIDAASVIVAQFVAKQMLDDIHSDMTRSVVAAASTYSWLMDQLHDNVVYVSQPDNGQQYTRLANGSYLSPQGQGEQLVQLANGTYRATSKHGLQYHFNASGQISEIIDRNQNSISYQYSAGMLTQISNNFGRSLVLSYGGNGLASVTADDGRSVSYTLSGGLLLSFTDTLGQSTSYHYQDEDYLYRVHTPEYPNHAAVINSYNAWGKVKEQISNIGGLHYYHIVPGYRAEEIGPLGDGYAVYFNNQGQVTRHIDSDGLLTRSEYDGLNRKVRVSYPEGNLELIEYDARFNPIKRTRKAKPGSSLSDIVVQTSFSNDYNLPLWQEDAVGNRVTHQYDSNGNLIRTTLPEVEVDGQLIQPYSQFSYQSNGLISSKTDPAGVVDSFTYYNNGQLHTHKQDDGGANFITSYSYNAAGDISSLTNARNRIFTYSHDTERRLVQENDPFGGETQYIYDGNGRQVQLKRKASNSSLYPDGWAVSHYSYTRDDKLLTETDPDGNTLIYTYNIQGQVVEIEDPDGRRQRLSYDSKQRVIKEEVLDGASWVVTAEYGFTDNGQTAWVKDANGNQTSFSYDGFDRLNQTTFADNSTSSSQYLPTGAVSSFTDRNHVVSSYQYDALNRLTEQQNGQDQRLTFSYTLQGQHQQIKQYQPASSNQAETLSFEYDNLQRLTKATNANNQAVRYQYNPLGQVTQLTYPDNTSVQYTYDTANRNYSIRYEGTELVNFPRNILGQNTRIRRANGLETQFSFNKAGQRSLIRHLFGVNQLHYSYQYNGSGQITQKNHLGMASPWLPQANQSIAYSSNNLNQYQSVGATSYSYDPNGNLSQAGTAYSYEHDALNQLTVVQPIGINQRIEYHYDALGRRKAKDSYGQLTFYLYSGNHAIAEYDAELNLTHKVIYAPGIDRPVAFIKNSQIYYYHQDEVGSVVALSNSAGQLVETYSYSPFGESNDISVVGNPLRYTARHWDEDAQLYYNRARYYNPELGRFIQPDPLGYADGLNIYAYVGNDPLNFVDPLGLYGQVANDYIAGLKGFVGDHLQGTVSLKAGYIVAGTVKVAVTPEGSVSVYTGVGLGMGLDVSAEAQLTSNLIPNSHTGQSYQDGLTTDLSFSGGFGGHASSGFQIGEGGVTGNVGLGTGAGASVSATIGYTWNF